MVDGGAESDGALDLGGTKAGGGGGREPCMPDIVSHSNKQIMTQHISK